MEHLGHDEDVCCESWGTKNLLNLLGSQLMLVSVVILSEDPDIGVHYDHDDHCSSSSRFRSDFVTLTLLCPGFMSMSRSNGSVCGSSLCTLRTMTASGSISTDIACFGLSF